jgi:membrane protease YdiL (CAAX protease family)
MSVNSSNQLHDRATLLRRIGFAFAAAGWVIGMYFVATVLGVLLFRSLGDVGVPLSNLSNNVMIFVSNALIWVIMIVLLLVPLKKWNIVERFKQEFGIERLLSWGDIGIALFAFIPYLILAGILTTLATMFLPGYDASQTQDIGFSELASRFELALAFFALVIAAPVIEEIIFRGFLYARLNKHLGVIGGVIGTSLVFAVLHMQLNVGLDVFALSIILCILRIVTGSIWAGIILHMVKNGVAFFILFVLPVIQ